MKRKQQIKNSGPLSADSREICQRQTFGDEKNPNGPASEETNFKEILGDVGNQAFIG